MDDWPNCIIAGCPRKCCLALDSNKCFPHTKGNEHVKRWKIQARNAPFQAWQEPRATRPRQTVE